jgi:hypothetical protein
MAGISVSSKTTSSVTLYVSGLDESWTNGTRTVYWYLGSAGGGIPTPSTYYKTKTSTIADGVSSGGSVTFSGLSTNTQYGVYCEIYHGSTFLKDLQGYVKTNATSSGSSIAKWSWSEGYMLAMDSEVIAARNAILNKTATTNFSHYVWNDLAYVVKLVMDKAVGWWDGDYATYDDVVISDGGSYELTADMFNSLRNNIEIAGDTYIGLGYRTGIGKVKSGDVVYGEYFLTLADYINACIDNL